MSDHPRVRWCPRCGEGDGEDDVANSWFHPIKFEPKGVHCLPYADLAHA